MQQSIQQRLTEKVTDNRTWAAILWIMACFTTALFVYQLEIPWQYAVPIGVGIQGIMSAIEQTVWRGKYSPIGLVVLGFDMYINSSSIWPWIRDNFGKTDAWKMAADMTGDKAQPSFIFLLGLTLAAGFVLARGPEYLWNWVPKNKG